MEARDAAVMAPAELQDHLRDTLDYVMRWRELMCPSGAVIDGMPRGGGFGSQMPYADYAADMADREIAAIGNLAKHTGIKLEYNGRPCIPGFDFRNGRCVGMVSEGELRRISKLLGGSYLYYPIQQQLNIMRANATLITRTAGVGEYLTECEKARRISMRQFKRVQDTWLTRKQVAEKYRLSERTVRDWGDSRTVEVLEDEYGERLYLQSSVEKYIEMAAEAKRNAAAKARSKKAGLRISAGHG